MLNASESSSPPMYEFLLKGVYSAYFGALYPQGECSLHAFRYSAHLSYVHTRDLVYAVSSTAGAAVATAANKREQQQLCAT